MFIGSGGGNGPFNGPGPIFSANLPANTGRIVGWGMNDYGQATPPVGNDYAAIAAGGFHNLTIAATGPALFILPKHFFSLFFKGILTFIPKP